MGLRDLIAIEGGGSPSWEEDRLWRLGREREGMRTAVRPLVERLQHYDSLRIEVERTPSAGDTLNDIANALQEPIEFCNSWGESAKASLVDPVSVRRALRDISLDLKLQVRRLVTTGMPVYLLARVRSDFWNEYSLQVEDLFMSLNYPVPDRRFVRLTDNGREVAYLRLADFRAPAARLIPEGSTDEDYRVDAILYDAARGVLQAAFHEDQQVAMAVARAFGLPMLLSAVELIYLVLTADLCQLRTAIDETLLQFFQRVYPQAAISAFLNRLLEMTEGREIDDLPDRAQNWHRTLSRAFRDWLRIEVPWGSGRKTKTPIWKLTLANLSRLQPVADRLRDETIVEKATERLAGVAERVIVEMTGRT